MSAGDVLFECDELTVTEQAEGVQISVGPGHSFRSQNLTAAETIRLAALLWLVAQVESAAPVPAASREAE